jgi:hypothetical protein
MLSDEDLEERILMMNEEDLEERILITAALNESTREEAIEFLRKLDSWLDGNSAN